MLKYARSFGHGLIEGGQIMLMVSALTCGSALLMFIAKKLMSIACS